MKFTVRWRTALENVLAAKWTSAANRQAITNAANAIDKLLESEPLSHVTPVDRLYFLRMTPLVVLVDIKIAERKVEVIDLHFVD